MKGSEVIEGDCLIEVPNLGPGQFDMILADPPFNVGKDYGAGIDDARPAEDYAAWLSVFYGLLFEAATTDATLYAFCPDKHLLGFPDLPGILRGAGWQPLQVLVWYRPNGPGPRHRAAGQVWARMSEFILLAVKGNGLPAKPSGLPEKDRQPWYHNVLTICTPQTNHPAGRWHVAQKPVLLYKVLLQAHSGIRRVLDPTVGSGSSLVACAELDIEAVGIELNPETYKLARRRVEAARFSLAYRDARRGTVPLFGKT